MTYGITITDKPGNIPDNILDHRLAGHVLARDPRELSDNGRDPPLWIHVGMQQLPREQLPVDDGILPECTFSTIPCQKSENSKEWNYLTLFIWFKIPTFSSKYYHGFLSNRFTPFYNVLFVTLLSISFTIVKYRKCTRASPSLQ